MGKSKYMFLPAWFCEASCKYKTQGIGEDLISLQCTSYELMVRAIVLSRSEGKSSSHLSMSSIVTLARSAVMN